MFRVALIASVLLVAVPALTMAQAAGKRVQVNGMQMHYELSGAGEPLVVLHGAYMNIPSMGAIIPKLAMPMADKYRKLAPNPDGFPGLVKKLIALGHEPMAWEADVKALKTPVLIITGDADVTTLEHSVAMFRLLGGGAMGDMEKPLSDSRLAVMPATSHTAVITQADLLYSFIEPFLKGETPKGMFEQ